MASKEQRIKKGKGVDLSTEWSEWVWEGEGEYWYASRYDSSGRCEYDYWYPEAPLATPKPVSRFESKVLDSQPSVSDNSNYPDGYTTSSNYAAPCRCTFP